MKMVPGSTGLGGVSTGQSTYMSLPVGMGSGQTGYLQIPVGNTAGRGSYLQIPVNSGYGPPTFMQIAWDADPAMSSPITAHLVSHHRRALQRPIVQTPRFSTISR